MSKTSGLLPCPFCGKQPYECSNGKSQFVAKCYTCGIVMSHDRADKLKGIWNKRKGAVVPWVAVSEGLPEHRQKVLFSTHKRDVHEAIYMDKLINQHGDFEKVFMSTDGGHYQLEMAIVQYWMPLPEPPLPERESQCCGRCDGVNDLCVADMICDEHDEMGCEICYGARDMKLEWI